MDPCSRSSFRLVQPNHLLLGHSKLNCRISMLVWIWFCLFYLQVILLNVILSTEIASIRHPFHPSSPCCSILSRSLSSPLRSPISDFNCSFSPSSFQPSSPSVIAFPFHENRRIRFFRELANWNYKLVAFMFYTYWTCSVWQCCTLWVDCLKIGRDSLGRCLGAALPFPSSLCGFPAISIFQAYANSYRPKPQHSASQPLRLHVEADQEMYPKSSAPVFCAASFDMHLLSYCCCSLNTFIIGDYISISIIYFFNLVWIIFIKYYEIFLK